MHPTNLSSHSETQSWQTFDKSSIDKLVVGLTGGIGSGKTMASNWFAEQGIDVVDADVVAHSIMQKGSPTLHRLAEAFGDWVIDNSGNMDRDKVRQYVFANNEALLTLESITHPAIRQHILEQLQATTSPYVILSAPLLLESAEAGLVSLCDRVLVIDVSESTQITRASGRDGENAEKIKAIMTNQLSREARLQHAHDVVNNEGSLQDLYDQLEPLHQQYLSFDKQALLR